MDHDNNEANLANAPYAFYQQDDPYHNQLSYPQPTHLSPYQVVPNPQTPEMLQMRNLSLLTHGGPNFSYPGSPTRLASNTQLPPSPSPIDTGSVYDHPISPPISGSDTSTDGSTYHTPHGTHSYSRESSSPPSIRRNHQHRYNPTAGHRRRRSSTNDEGDFSDDEQGGSSMLSGQALAEQLSNSRKEATRKQRIEAEQRRRDELRDGYARLKNVLPVTNQKSSKVSLLERATNHIIHIDGQNKILIARVSALETQVARLREVNERLALTVAQHTGHMPNPELEMAISQNPPNAGQYDEHAPPPPIEARPLSPPPDIQPQAVHPHPHSHSHTPAAVTPQPITQHQQHAVQIHPHAHHHDLDAGSGAGSELAHQPQQPHQPLPQLHQPQPQAHPHPHPYPHPIQMYQHRNDSTASHGTHSASGSEYGLN